MRSAFERLTRLLVRAPAGPARETVVFPEGMRARVWTASWRTAVEILRLGLSTARVRVPRPLRPGSPVGLALENARGETRNIVARVVHWDPERGEAILRL